jgi:hypothetical protein
MQTVEKKRAKEVDLEEKLMIIKPNFVHIFAQ